jgi:hypothetical protein
MLSVVVDCNDLRQGVCALIIDLLIWPSQKVRLVVDSVAKSSSPPLAVLQVPFSKEPCGLFSCFCAFLGGAETHEYVDPLI